jgi:proteic killer suppression protein
MEIKFTDKKLAKLVNNDAKMLKEYGSLRFKLLRRRLSQLAGAKTLEDVRDLPGNYHELTANRKGQWACDLDQPYRLAFTPIVRPIPLNDDGQYIWIEITSIEILEIIDYH